jgi:RNAse (barnase) inhibitor barstar
MADILSQNDLDALWGLSSGEQSERPAPPDTESVSAAGITQADLDALWGALGGGNDGTAAVEQKEPAYTGVSQGDLDALWGLARTEVPQEPVIAEAETPAPTAENLSQDDIDRLLSEMGK